MRLGVGVGIGYNNQRGAGGGGIAPGLSGSISNTTVTQGTGTTTIATSGGFTGSGLTYALEDTLSGFALPGMSINSTTGVITCTRSALRRGLRYLRVTASNGFGPDVHQDFNVFVRFETFDFVATTLAEWDAIAANSAETLSGKVIAVSMAIANKLVMPAKSPAMPITITTGSHTDTISDFEFNGGGPFILDGAINKKISYPNGNWIIRGSTSPTTVDVINCDLSHNYRGGILDPSAALPEYNKGQLDARTATVTSTAYALVHRDVAMPSGYVTVSNSGAAIVYANLGNSGVVATTGNTAIGVGASVRLSFSGTLPTHIALLSASGSQSVSYRSEQGLSNYVCSAFSSAGGATMSGRVVGNAFHDLDNAIKGFASNEVDNNDIFRVYQDGISTGGNSNSGVTQYFTRNRIGLPFGNAASAGNPHSDWMQMFNEGAISPAKNQVIAGNVVYNQVSNQTDRAQCFVSDHPGGYQNTLIIGNAIAGANINAIYVGELATSDKAIDGMAYGNTAFYLQSPSDTATINLVNDTNAPSYAARNIAQSVQAGMLENNDLVNAGNVATIFPSSTALGLALSYKSAVAAYTASVARGAAWAWSTGIIDFNAASASAVVNLALVPPGIIWPDFTDVAVSSVQTTPWRRVKGGGGTVTPSGGTEWQSSSDDGTTIVQNWTSGAGTIARGHVIRIRETSSALPETTTQMDITINGFAHSVSITTAVAAAANFVGRRTYATTLNPQTISITSLTGGIGSAPINGDLVIVTYACASNTIRSLTITTAGYTTQGMTFANAANDTSGVVGWKIMGGSPDTTVDLGGATVAGNGATVVVQVYRGINAATPINAGPTNASGINGKTADPASVTTTVANAQVVVIAACAGASTATDLYGAAYLQSKSAILGPGNFSSSLFVGDIIVPTAITYNPAALTISNGTAGDTWSSVTLALTPI